jgi:hypothetical protein
MCVCARAFPTDIHTITFTHMTHTKNCTPYTHIHTRTQMQTCTHSHVLNTHRLTAQRTQFPLLTLSAGGAIRWKHKSNTTPCTQPSKLDANRYKHFKKLQCLFVHRYQKAFCFISRPFPSSARRACLSTLCRGQSEISLACSKVCEGLQHYASPAPHMRNKLTYANVCWRMLTYADVCWRMLTYADVCWRMQQEAPHTRH